MELCRCACVDGDVCCCWLLQIINDSAQQTVTVVSAMGSCAESPVKVTDLILNMIDKAARQVRNAAQGRAGTQQGCQPSREGSRAGQAGRQQGWQAAVEAAAQAGRQAAGQAARQAGQQQGRQTRSSTGRHTGSRAGSRARQTAWPQAHSSHSKQPLGVDGCWRQHQ
jgi:hypothetical protein